MNVPHHPSASRSHAPGRSTRAFQACACRRPVPAAILAGIVAALALAGCSEVDTTTTEFAPACAPVGILGDAADYSDYGPGAVPDLSRLVAQGSIRGVSGHCNDAAGGTVLHTVVQLQLAITRGPVATGSSLAVPYFIAVTRDGAVLSKQTLVATAQFPDNGDKVALQTDPVAFDLPVSRAHPGTSYRIEAGFQLTPEQLSYNRAHPPR